MTFSIGMRTVLRPQQYCYVTLERLLQSRTLEHPALVGLHLSHGDGLPPNANAIRALRRAVADAADWVVFLEDDIDIIDDFIGSLARWLQVFARADVLAYPLASFYPTLTRARHDIGMYEIPLTDYYGSQAVVFRTEDAEDYAAWLEDYADEVLPPRPGRLRGFDMRLAEWHREQRPMQACLITPAPCFVDHLGEHSLMGLWSETGRVLDFAGRAWRFAYDGAERQRA